MARVTWKHTLPYVKWTVNGSLPYDSGKSNWGSVNNLEGRDGERGRRGGSVGRGHMYNVADSY